MQMKLIELRDVATTMPMMAIELSADNARHAWILERAGYDPEMIDNPNNSDGRYVLLVNLCTGTSQTDPFKWGNRRTLTTAHLHLVDHWHDVADGAVLDVRFILGETREPVATDQRS